MPAPERWGVIDFGTEIDSFDPDQVVDATAVIIWHVVSERMAWGRPTEDSYGLFSSRKAAYHFFDECKRPGSLFSVRRTPAVLFHIGGGKGVVGTSIHYLKTALAASHAFSGRTKEAVASVLENCHGDAFTRTVKLYSANAEQEFYRMPAAEISAQWITLSKT